MTDIAVDTVRLRGPHARRLATVAARALPAALERAMAAVGDVRLDRIEVCLDLDPADYDDETLAILWADAIRAQVHAAAPSIRPPDRPPSLPAGPETGRPLEPGEVLAAVRDWVATVADPPVPHQKPVVPSAVLALGDPEVARAVRAVAGADEWARLLAAVENALRGTDIRVPRPEERAVSPTVAPGSPGPEAPRTPGTQADSPSPPAAAEHAAAAADERVAVLDSLAVLAELTAVPASPEDPAPVVPAAGVDLDAVTRVAGLVLLYPWLADHCRKAEALHPDLDAVDVREAALAAIVDPDDRALADDHLVDLLAGRPEALAEKRFRVTLSHLDEVVESGTRVLASFAAMLPGFGGSTAAFVRDSWLWRLGVVHRDRDPALLVAARHPLDVVLPLLPYPVGLVKLPWSPPVSVRFAP